MDNITDWALQHFQEQYEDTSISKIDIFHYVYAVLHDPAYRQKYEKNLKRDFPRIPYHDDFSQWVAWGRRLVNLHLNYMTAPLHDVARNDHAQQDVGKPYSPILRSNKAEGLIELDSQTSLTEIPQIAWDYTLGNRSALDWVLERYKETNPRDPTIREHFNAYRFIDHKEEVVELLKKVVTVSVETMKITSEMSEIEV